MVEMVENEQLPAWLVELREQQLGEQTQEQPVEDLQTQASHTDAVVDLQEQEQEPEQEQEQEQVPKDMLDDLREQMILTEEDYYKPERTPFYRPFLNLKPAQRLVLAVLLFLNVALCGCMALVMAERVVLPF